MEIGLQHAQNLIGQSDVSGILVVSPPDIRYLTGIPFSQGTLLITRDKALLFIDPRYRILAEKLPKDFDVFCSRDRSKMATFIQKGLFDISGSIGFDASTMTVETFRELSTLAVSSKFVAVPSIFSNLRRPKRYDEIMAIEKACTLCEQGFVYLVEQIREGITEQELSKALKIFWFKNGAEAVSFEPIIAFGPNSACPHWSSSSTSLARPSVILIDIGVQLYGYHSDMTRTLFFGPPDAELLFCHSLLQEAYTLGYSLARPGVSPSSLDNSVREFLTKKGYGDAFVHSLGHGVGLEIHEPPRIQSLDKGEYALEKGDVITLEPGIYLPGHGGLRVENTIVIESCSARSLFSSSIAPLLL